jgi:hypothetical protein
MLGLLGLVGKFAAGFVVTWVIGIVVPHHETSVTLSGAIADRTLRASKTVDAFRANFHDRLAVLDRAGRTASTTPTTPAASSREADYWAVRSNRGRRNKSEEQAHMTEPTNEELATCEAEALDIGAAFHAFLEAKERWIDAYQKDGSDRFAALTQLIRYLIAEREASAGGPSGLLR